MAITGKINEPVTLKSEQAGNWVQLSGPQVILRIGLDQKTCSFTPPANGTYKINHNNESFEVIVGGTVPTPTPEPTPTPTPTPTGTLWDSNVNGQWNNGVKRTLTTKEGGQKPNDKSIFVAASGNPVLIIDGDGVAHLKSGSGGVDNLSIRLRSRHQGEFDNITLAPEKRFGGHGWSVDKSGGVGFKTEDYHNEHSNSHDFNSGISIGETWHHVKQTLKGQESTFTLDNKLIGKVQCMNSGDDSLLPKNSYIWLRLNNSDHGRIYICAINIDSQLDFDFKFEQATSSIAFRNVRLVSI